MYTFKYLKKKIQNLQRNELILIKIKFLIN